MADAVSAGSLGSAQTTEDKFQSLYDSGAFEHKPLADKAAPKAADNTPTEPVEATGSPDEPVAEEAAPEEPEYRDLDEYLTKAGLERDSFLNLATKVKVDGQEVSIPLAEALKGYSREEHFTRKSQDLAQKQQAWEGERQSALNLLEGQIKQAKNLGELAKSQLLQEFNGINWSELYQQDPARWAATQQLFNNRAGAIEQHLNQLTQQEQQVTQQRQADDKKALQGEFEKLFNVRPEWRDEAKFTAAKAAMRAVAKELGYTDAEIDGIRDHRQMLALQKLSQVPALQAKQEAKLKQVRAAPQISNAGARVTRDPKAVAFKQDKAAWSKNPRDQDAAVRVFDHFA